MPKERVISFGALAIIALLSCTTMPGTQGNNSFPGIDNSAGPIDSSPNSSSKPMLTGVPSLIRIEGDLFLKVGESKQLASIIEGSNCDADWRVDSQYAKFGSVSASGIVTGITAGPLLVSVHCGPASASALMPIIGSINTSRINLPKNVTARHIQDSALRQYKWLNNKSEWRNFISTNFAAIDGMSDASEVDFEAIDFEKYSVLGAYDVSSSEEGEPVLTIESELISHIVYPKILSHPPGGSITQPSMIHMFIISAHNFNSKVEFSHL